MKISKAEAGAWAELEPGEDIYALLLSKDQELLKYRHTITAILADEKNKDLLARRKQFWWIGTGDKVFLAEKDAAEVQGKAQPGWRHHLQLHRYPPAIDVYMGFMDEEVNARLAKIIRNEKAKGDKARAVILIERGRISLKDPILEWQLKNYEIDENRAPLRSITQVSPRGEMVVLKPDKAEKTVPLSVKPGQEGFFTRRKTYLENLAKQLSKEEQSAAPENILARAMAVFMETSLESDLDWLARGIKTKRYFDVIQLLQHRGNPKTKSKLPKEAGGEGPWLSVIRFDVGPADEKLHEPPRAPIIVIRTPEMGLQPSLMCPYLAFLFKALSAFASELAALEAKALHWVVTEPKKTWGKKENENKLWIKEGKQKKLKKWDVWEWPLRISQFGAQGSSSTAFTPGSTVSVIASLFVGFEIASDIKMSAQPKSGNRQSFIFKSSEDATESSPHRQAVNLPFEGIDPNTRKYSDVRTDSATANCYAVISLCTPAGVYDFLREKISSYDDIDKLIRQYGLDAKLKDSMKLEKPDKVIEAAQDMAAAIFRTQTEEKFQALLKLKKCTIDKDSPFYKEEEGIRGEGVTLKTTIEKLKEAYKQRFFDEAINPRGVVTLTVSYFGGDADKDASDKLGIIGVNMEDYHVLRVLRSALAKGASEQSDYPIILGWRIDRINCDPKKLPAGIDDKFNKFGTTDEAMLTEDDYVKAIVWGHRGVLRTDINADLELKKAVRWKFLDDEKNFKSMEEIKPFFWSFVTHEKAAISEEDRKDFWVPDPFCVEIATDFAKELADMKPWAANPGGIGRIDEVLLNGISKGKADLAGHRLDTIQTHAEVKDMESLRSHLPAKDGGIGDMLNTWFERISELRARAQAVLDADNPEPAARDLMTALKNYCGFDSGKKWGEKPLLKTWLRPGKWDKSITEPTLQDAAKAGKFKAAAIDRAFYKSSNMMALQLMADYFMWEGGKKPILKA